MSEEGAWIWNLMFQNHGCCSWQGKLSNVIALQVDIFVYLAWMLTKDGKVDGEFLNLVNVDRKVIAEIWSAANNE